jgi:RNA polymerase sigma-70 factor (ECF subfamily)
MMDDRTRQAFALWTQAQPAVSAFVHAMLADRSERDDVLQEVAIAVLESFDDYDATRPFTPWAIGIARNVVLSAVRRARRRPLALDPVAADAFAAAVAEVADADRANLAHLADCLRRLDGRAREICELRYRSDLKPGRIAEVMGLQPNTVSKALQRAREDLRACIERRAGFEEGRA